MDYNQFTQGQVHRFGDNAFNTNLEVQDWDKILYDMFLESDMQFIPFIEKFCGGSIPSDSYKFEWGEFDQEQPRDEVASSSEGNVVFDDDNFYKSLIKDDVLYNLTEDEYYIVTDTPTGNSVSMNEVGVDSVSSAAAPAAEDVLIRLYTMKKDGSHESDALLQKIAAHKQTSNEFNYIGTFEKFSHISEHEANQNWIISNITKRAHQNLVKLKELMQELEFNALKGKLSINSGENISMGKGLLNYGIKTCSSDGSWDNLMTFVREKVKDKNKLSVIPTLINYKGLHEVQQMLSDAGTPFTLNLSGQGDKRKAGMRYFELITPLATLELYPNRALGELYSDSIMITLDPNTIARRHIRNMNVQTRYDVQPKRSHFFLDQHYATQGLQLANADKTAMWTWSSMAPQ